MYRARIAKKPEASTKKNLLGKCENAQNLGNIGRDHNLSKKLRNRCSGSDSSFTGGQGALAPEKSRAAAPGQVILAPCPMLTASCSTRPFNTWKI
jgi:hypothetical protein